MSSQLKGNNFKGKGSGGLSVVRGEEEKNKEDDLLHEPTESDFRSSRNCPLLRSTTARIGRFNWNLDFSACR